MKICKPVQTQRASEKGSALVYILIAIALLAALTASFMEPSSQQTSSQNTFKTVSALTGQVNTVRSAIQECLLLYPRGDTTINNPTVTDTGYNTPYPLNPNSTHLPVSYRASDINAANIRCPGDAEGGVAAQHALIFGGASGKFLAPPPDLFEPWQYYNGPDGVFYWTESSKSDAFIETALARLDEKFGACEVDIIDATAAAKDLDGDSTVACSVNSLCLRVWMKTDTETIADAATSTYPDETACNTP